MTGSARDCVLVIDIFLTAQRRRGYLLPTDKQCRTTVQFLFLLDISKPRNLQTATRSHPEMVGDMSRVTLNFDLSKIPFVHF